MRLQDYWLQRTELRFVSILYTSSKIACFLKDETCTVDGMPCMNNGLCKDDMCICKTPYEVSRFCIVGLIANENSLFRARHVKS
jgi:hypothetical protein